MRATIDKSISSQLNLYLIKHKNETEIAKSQGKPNGKPNRGAGKVGHNQKPYFKNKNNQKAKGVSEKIKYVL